MSQKIKFVVVATSSRRDINGNCYHIAAVTNTENGASVHFHTGGAGNARYLIKEMFSLKHGETLDIERDLGIRDFNVAKKYVKLHEHEEDEIRKVLKGGEKIMSEYEKQANDLLKSMKVKFKVEFVKYGSHFEDETQMRDIYKCVFSRGDDNLVIKFGQSIVNSVKGIPPTAYDVIACMEKYDPEDFGFWCDNLGYDSDSRRAERIYKSCVKQWQQVGDFFTEEELEELREVQ